MNPHILIVIDNQLNPDKYTQEQLDKNTDDAHDAYDAAAAAYAATYAYAAAAYAYYDDDDYWLGRYFKITGENKQDYIDAINKDNK